MADTYILAPNTQGNFAVLQTALADYPLIVAEKRVKYVFAKSEGDILDDEGVLLVAENPETFIYLCATTDISDPILQAFLAMITGATTYTIDTQPFSLYWL